MCNPDAVMIFAAGFGTRMGSLTADRPKPLVTVSGRPLIDHALDQVKAIGPINTVVNTHYKAEMLADHLRFSGVAISHETEKILDTGGGLRKALPLLKSECVFTLNSDAIFQGPSVLAHLQKAWKPQEMDALLLCVPMTRAIGGKGEGDFSANPQGQLSRGGNWVYTGVQIFKTDKLQHISEEVFSLNLVWDQIIAERRAFMLEYPGHWCDVGHPEGITRAEEMIASTNV